MVIKTKVKKYWREGRREPWGKIPRKYALRRCSLTKDPITWGSEPCKHPGKENSRQKEQQVQRSWERNVPGALRTPHCGGKAGWLHQCWRTREWRQEERVQIMEGLVKHRQMFGLPVIASPFTSFLDRIPLAALLRQVCKSCDRRREIR